MLVPLSVCHWPRRLGAADRISTPGAETSGFKRSDSGVGPAEEKPASCRLTVVAATVIADAAEPGDETDPRPKASKSFPAETADTTPAAAAPSMARTTRSRLGGISGSPIERLMTSIPSCTAASMAAAISGELPSSPTLDTVGTVNTR